MVGCAGNEPGSATAWTIADQDRIAVKLIGCASYGLRLGPDQDNLVAWSRMEAYKQSLPGNHARVHRFKRAVNETVAADQIWTGSSKVIAGEVSIPPMGSIVPWFSANTTPAYDFLRN